MRRYCLSDAGARWLGAVLDTHAGSDKAQGFLWILDDVSLSLPQLAVHSGCVPTVSTFSAAAPSLLCSSTGVCCDSELKRLEQDVVFKKYKYCLFLYCFFRMSISTHNICTNAQACLVLLFFYVMSTHLASLHILCKLTMGSICRPNVTL